MAELIVNNGTEKATFLSVDTRSNGQLSDTTKKLISTIITNGGGLKTDNTGRISVDFSLVDFSTIVDTMSEEDIRALIQALVTEDSAITTDENGKLTIDFSQMPKEQLENIVLAMVQTGGGISVDSNGQLYVDFASMPTDKFEAMLKSIRVPIWLTKNTNFYVNGSTGSDTLDNGRGLSTSKPFKTIQACVSYVCDNYNLSNYNVFIIIADGVYNESVTLPAYSTSTGSITIRSENPGGVTIQAENSTVLDCSRGSIYQIYNLKLIANITPNTTSRQVQRNIFRIVNSSTVTLHGLHITVNFNGEFTNNLTSVGAILCSNSGAIAFSDSDIGYSITLNSNTSSPFIALWGTTKGLFTAYSSYDESQETGMLWTVSGNMTTGAFLRLDSGASFSMNRDLTWGMRFTGTMQGKRYVLSTGATCDVNGKGEGFFPGDQTGNLDANTYCWYA